ncbi:MAG: hypothetical protein COA62_05570 [Rhodobiaceae bacterium]|nr:MAG: hypothetical protein COA62_05570 [Rhodobiaceae bacterium]
MIRSKEDWQNIHGKFAQHFQKHGLSIERFEALIEPRETSYFSLKQENLRESVLALYAVIAYPERSDIPKRNNLVAAGKAWLTKAYIRNGGDRSKTVPRFRQTPNQQIDGQLNMAFGRIYKRRIRAALIADQIIMREFGFGGDTLESARFTLVDPDGRGWRFSPTEQDPTQRATVTSVIRDFSHQLGGAENTSNTMHRVWAESLPILHLAMQLKVEMSKPYPGDGTRHKLLSLLVNPDWISDALWEAERRRIMVCAMMLKIGPQHMVRIMPKEIR